MGVQRDGAESAVLAFLGDGATSQGEVNEAMIFAASFSAPVVFFCQNNQYAISVPLERQTRIPLFQRAAGFGFPGVRVDGNDVLAVLAVTRAALAAAREGQGPTFIEAFTYRMGAHTTSDDPTRYRLASELEEWKLRDPIARLKAYLSRSGIADAAFFDSRRRRGRRAGRPDPAAARWRWPTPSRPACSTTSTPSRRRRWPPSARSSSSTTRASRGASTDEPETLTIGKALNLGLRKAMEDDPKVVLMGEDIGKLGGVFRITDGLQKDFGEDRVVDTPLAEAGILGTAVGLAMRGYRPVCEIQFDGFVFPAYNQIVTQVAKIHARSKGMLPMPIVIRIPFGGGIGAVEHHSESPEAYFAHTAGLKVVAVSNPVDAYWGIQQAIAHPDPIVFLEPKRRYWEKARGRHRRDARARCSAPGSSAVGTTSPCWPTARW